jgi:hypothetical protein
LLLRLFNNAFSTTAASSVAQNDAEVIMGMF